MLAHFNNEVWALDIDQEKIDKLSEGGVPFYEPKLKELVREGLAVARFSPENKKYKKEILEAELYARENKLGCKWREVEEDFVVEVVQDKEEVVDNLEYDCSSNVYNCGDFKTHAEAQKVFEACGGVNNDVHKLDRDGDGDACETLG